MWFAILITVIAATGNNIGKALQKEAVHSLPRFSVQPAVFREYCRNQLWLVGLAADLGGALLMIAAFALAPVSLVQPVSGVGLVSLAVFSHFHLKERLATEEWLAVAMAAVGTLGLGVSSEDSPAADPSAPPASPSGFGLGSFLSLAAFLAVLAAGVAYGSRLTSAQKRKSASGARTAATVHGLQAGVCFGLSAASCKTGITMVARVGWLAFPVGLAGSVLMSSLGFMLQTLGLKDGNTVIVCTCAAVSSMATGVLVGLLAMGESLPLGWSMKLLRFLSWVVTMLGVSALANGKGGFQEVAMALVSILPRNYRPRFAARKASKEDGLPLSDTTV